MYVQKSSFLSLWFNTITKDPKSASARDAVDYSMNTVLVHSHACCYVLVQVFLGVTIFMCQAALVTDTPKGSNMCLACVCVYTLLKKMSIQCVQFDPLTQSELFPCRCGSGSVSGSDLVRAGQVQGRTAVLAMEAILVCRLETKLSSCDLVLHCCITVN